MFVALIALFVSCSSSRPQIGYQPDAVYDGLQIGMTKQDIIAVLGEDYQYDMNNVTQTQTNYIETLIWNSADPNVVYVLSFVDNKLSRKNREQVVKENGKNVQLNR